MSRLTRRELGLYSLSVLPYPGAWPTTGSTSPSASDVPDFSGRALGAFVHGAPHDAQALDRFAELIQRSPAIVMWFDEWGSANAITGETVDLDLLRTVTERGAVPMITWEPWNPFGGIDQPDYRLTLIARGDFDAYINAWAYRLSAYGGPVWLRFAHEMNAPWYPWGIHVNHNSAQDYIAAWRHIRERFDAAGASNVRWVWCVDATTAQDTSVTAAYPGDDVVDWVALDGYNWGTSLPNSSWRTATEVFGEAYSAIASLTGRPLMIAEMGCAEQGGDKATWIQQAFSEISTHFPRVAAVCWFNESGDVSDWRVESSPSSLTAFRAVASGGQWLGYPESNP